MFTLVSLIQFPFFQQSEFLNKRKDDDSSRLLSEISGNSVLFVCANPSISDILECLPHCVDHCEYLKLCRIFCGLFIDAGENFSKNSPLNFACLCFVGHDVHTFELQIHVTIETVTFLSMKIIFFWYVTLFRFVRC
jgi:hypothetical protein